ncbi:hypothetical protein M0802_014067 [Mischocyttarus mexicanus]|nr:hypothetical protein M0802_014067 [Mischocyttarus mexicanus]
MATLKVIFHLAAESDIDPRTTIIKVKTIQTSTSDRVYCFEEEDQPSRLHGELFKLPIIQNVVKSLNRRGKSRRIAVTLAEKLYKLYFVEEGNFVFQDFYLTEAPCLPPPSVPQTPTSSNIPPAILNEPPFDLRSASQSIILEPFHNKNQNAKLWLNLFKSECQRLNIPKENYFEILRLFLTGSPLEWYETHFESSITEWKSYETSVITTFDESSWHDVGYAYSYHWVGGSYLDYAIKKRNLLLRADNSLSVQTQINFIVLGLPKYLYNYLNKSNIDSIDQLMSQLRQYKSNDKHNRNRTHNINPNNRERRVNYSPIQPEN